LRCDRGVAPSIGTFDQSDQGCLAKVESKFNKRGNEIITVTFILFNTNAKQAEATEAE